MKAVVMGMGVTGRAVADALLARGHDVVAFDDRPSDAVHTWAATQNLSVITPGADEVPAALASADVAIPAPGLPDTHSFFADAASAGVDIVSEFDLAAEWDARPCVAVTGTDGKTTVVNLIDQMLTASGVASAMVGNTDTPWVTAIDNASTDVFVVEASSFRLAHSRRFAPQVAVWLNFGPDHLDAHRTLDDYEAAKASIFEHVPSDGLVIANRDDATVARYAAAVTHTLVETFGLDEGTHGVADGNLVVGGEPLLRIEDLVRSLPHDQANALAASAAALAIGATREGVATALRNFEGLEHRVEFVLEHDGVRWFNDSKATTPHASEAGLSGFDSVVLLAGGRNKGLSFDGLASQGDRLRHVVALGESADLIVEVFDGIAATTTATSMSEAIEQADAAAQPGDVVLLSPACASFDWYRNYGARGDDFKRLVRERFEGNR